MIVSSFLTWLHVNGVRMWHHSLCQEEIKLHHLHITFFVFCLVCRITG